jgi:hypothetical protein
MTGYIQADQVTEGMVLDLTSPTSGDFRYFWRVEEAVTKTSTYLHLTPHTVDNPADLVPERTVRLRHDERVWVTGWGVQPADEVLDMVPEDEGTVFAWHPKYCFGTDLEVWMVEGGQQFVGATWTTGHYTTYATVPAEEVTVGVAEAER